MMLGLLLVVLGLAGSALVDAKCCSEEDRHEIAFLWNHAWGSAFTDRKLEISRAIFDELFEKHPESKELFKRVHVDDEHSPEFEAHLIRVANGIDTVINLLEDPLAFTAHVHHLEAQHMARKGIKKVHFDAFVDASADVLHKVSSCFNQEAWKRCLKRATDVIAHDLH